MTTETARQQVISALQRAGINVDPSNSVRDYTGGICFVNSESGTIGDPELLTVIAVVNMGSQRPDYDVYRKRVTDAINGSDEGTAVSFSIELGGEPPIGGRDFPEGDYATISVSTCEPLD